LAAIGEVDLPASAERMKTGVEKSLRRHSMTLKSI
jgi:hypothetical protein